MGYLFDIEILKLSKQHDTTTITSKIRTQAISNLCLKMNGLSSANFFSLFYFLFCAGFLLQSREFIGAGLTPENILSRWLDTDYNSENIHFIQHHIVKTSGTLIIHLSLPLIYLFGYSYFSLVVDGSFDTIDDLIEVYPPF